MKRTLVLSVGAILLLSSCGSYAGVGAYTGGSFGSIIGSAIGGIAGGPRGSDIGTLIGLAGGAVVGSGTCEIELTDSFSDAEISVGSAAKTGLGVAYTTII